MVDRLQPRQNTAARELDRVIAEARVNLIGDTLHAFLEGAISLCDSYLWFLHQAFRFTLRVWAHGKPLL